MLTVGMLLVTGTKVASGTVEWIVVTVMVLATDAREVMRYGHAAFVFRVGVVSVRICHDEENELSPSFEWEDGNVAHLVCPPCVGGDSTSLPCGEEYFYLDWN